MVIVVILGFGLIALVQAPVMFKNKWWSDLVVYGIIYFLAFSGYLLYTLGLPIPGPTKILTVFMQVIYQLIGLQLPE